MASSTLVLPTPLGPTMTVVPDGSGSSVTAVRHRKSVMAIDTSCMRSDARVDDPGYETRTGINR